MFTWWFRTHSDGWIYLETHETMAPLPIFNFWFCANPHRVFEIFLAGCLLMYLKYFLIPISVFPCIPRETCSSLDIWMNLLEMKYPLNWAGCKGLKTQTESSLLDWNQPTGTGSRIESVLFCARYLVYVGKCHFVLACEHSSKAFIFVSLSSNLCFDTCTGTRVPGTVLGTTWQFVASRQNIRRTTQDEDRRGVSR